MSAADDRAVIAALRAGHHAAGPARVASGLSAPAFKASVQRLRYQGKLQWDSLQLTASMLEVEDVAPASPGTAPDPVEGLPASAGTGEDAGALPPVAPASEPAPAAPVKLLSAAEQLLRDIDAWCARTDTPEGKLGGVALRHPGFVPLLRKRLTATPDTIAKVRRVMAKHPEGLADVAVPAINICVPKPVSIEARVTTVTARAPAGLPASPFDVAVKDGVSAVAELVREEAEAAAQRRKAARAISGLAGGELALLPDPSAVEMVTTALAETVDDAARAMARRWPQTWVRVLAAARAAEERPGQALIRLLELGLAQAEVRRG